MKQNNEMTPRKATECRLNYPFNARILHEHMDDKYAVPDSTRDTVEHVDEAAKLIWGGTTAECR